MLWLEHRSSGNVDSLMLDIPLTFNSSGDPAGYFLALTVSGVVLDEPLPPSKDNSDSRFSKTFLFCIY